jgi:hypothetical protein
MTQATAAAVTYRETRLLSAIGTEHTDRDKKINEMDGKNSTYVSTARIRLMEFWASTMTGYFIVVLFCYICSF